MRLVLIRRKVWVVLAVAYGESAATVVEDLEDRQRDYRHAEDMLALIRDYVPGHGPPKNPNRCAPLGDGIFEFKYGPKRGKKLRVLWFYDDGEPKTRNAVICTTAFYKRDETSETDKRRALAAREELILAKKQGTLVIDKTRETNNEPGR